MKYNNSNESGYHFYNNRNVELNWIISLVKSLILEDKYKNSSNIFNKMSRNSLIERN